MLKAIARDWNEFWFRPRASGPLGVLRMAIGLLTMACLIQQWPDRFAFYADDGVLPRSLVPQFTAIFTPGPRPINPLMATTSHAVITVFFVVFLLTAFTLTIGFWSRTSVFLCAVFLNALHNRDPIMNSTGGDCVMLITCLYLMLAPCGASCSVDRLIRILRGREGDDAPKVVPWAWRLAQVQVSICYLTTFLLKMPGDLWQNGTAVYYPAALPEFHRFPMPWMDGNHIWWINILTYGTLAIELALGTLIWVPRLRLYVLALGVVLHLGIEYSMNIPLFGALMVASYTSFLQQSDLEWLRQRMPRWIRLGRLKMVYDGECDFCRSCLLVIRFLDVFRAVTFYDYQHPDELAESGGVRYEDADEAAIAVDERGRQYAGYYAFREVARRTPALWLLVPILYVPGVPALGRGAYAWIATHRKYLPVAPRYKSSQPTVSV